MLLKQLKNILQYLLLSRAYVSEEGIWNERRTTAALKRSGGAYYSCVVLSSELTVAMVIEHYSHAVGETEADFFSIDEGIWEYLKHKQVDVPCINSGII